MEYRFKRMLLVFKCDKINYYNWSLILFHNDVHLFTKKSIVFDEFINEYTIEVLCILTLVYIQMLVSQRWPITPDAI